MNASNIVNRMGVLDFYALKGYILLVPRIGDKFGELVIGELQIVGGWVMLQEDNGAMRIFQQASVFECGAYNEDIVLRLEQKIRDIKTAGGI